MPYSFTPDIDKTREAIIYIAKRCPNVTLYYVLKIMYFAEKAHCEKYGRLIFGNHIDASYEHGPVPREAYRLINHNRFLQPGADGFKVLQKIVVPDREPDYDVFSESEIECMDEYLDVCKLPFEELREKSHDASYDATNGLMTLEEFTMGMENREEILNHLKDPFP